MIYIMMPIHLGNGMKQFSKEQRTRTICFSSPFDESAVDFFDLGVSAYKIASLRLITFHITKVASKGKPLIISTGMATLADIERAVVAANEAGCSELILLKCTSTYPASPENTNIRTIPNLRTTFKTEVGLSDHTMGIGAVVASVALGASVIEKHFTLSRSDGGVDSAFSLEPSELKSLVLEAKEPGILSVAYLRPNIIRTKKFNVSKIYLRFS